MAQIYSENYFWNDTDYELVGFRDNNKVLIKIYVVNEQGKHAAPQFTAVAEIDQIHDGNILGVDLFQEMVEYAKGHIHFAAILQGISDDKADIFGME